MEETQICFKCNKEKLLSEFYKHSQMKNGHLGKCKECAKRDVRENYQKNRVSLAIYDQLRNTDEKRKKRKIERQRILRKLYPLKYKARLKVANALRDGKIQKQPCQMCGSQYAQAHHDDYNKPLDVTWLCYGCHLKEHGKNARIAA